jgi:hypothetical protein
MKKCLITLTFAFLSFATFAQSAKFQQAMGQALGQMGAAKTADDWKNVANTFARIAGAESTEWLPQYYAAFSRLNAGYILTQSNMAEAQALATAALNEVKAGQKIAPQESELTVLEAFAYQLQLLEDPMGKGPAMMGQIYTTLGKAEALNPQNPRVYCLRGNFSLNVPAFAGGGPEKAAPDLKKALEAYANFKPASPFSPNWGKGMAEELAAKLK